MPNSSSASCLSQCLVGAVIIAVAAIAMFWSFLWKQPQPSDMPSMTFNGPSTELQQTVVLPTLDTPIPEGKSAIWCSSFQLAWNRLKDDLMKEPIQLQGAKDASEQLNRAGQTEADLPAHSFYAAAGLVRDGIIEQIRRDMGRMFPEVRMPDFGNPTVAVAYAYLKAGVKFTHPYSQNENGLPFVGGKAEQKLVRSFGIRSKDETLGEHTFREQVEELFSTHSSGKAPDGVEFALDLDRHSAPNQLVLARIQRKPTLAGSLADLRNKVTQSTPQRRYGKLGPTDTLLVPNMNWRIEHRFAELEERPLLNKLFAGTYIGRAFQIIDFHLDRGGAGVESKAQIFVEAKPREFHFDRPFLLYLKKRDAIHPFFVMWVDNAELLAQVK